MTLVICGITLSKEPRSDDQIVEEVAREKRVLRP
jgi:hypothetical protein